MVGGPRWALCLLACADVCSDVWWPQVDTAGFQSEMDAQRQRSKDSREELDLTQATSLATIATQVRGGGGHASVAHWAA